MSRNKRVAYTGEDKDIYSVCCELYPDGSPLYPNSSAYLEKFLQVYDNSKYDIFYILHDKDIHEDGTLIKPHIHFAMRRAEGGTFSLKQFMYTLQVSINNCFKIDNFNAYLQYCLHRTKESIEDGKHKYEVNELWSNFDVIPLLTNTDNDRYKTEYEIVKEMYIFLIQNHYDWDLLFDYVGEKGYYKIYKSSLKVLDHMVKRRMGFLK